MYSGGIDQDADQSTSFESLGLGDRVLDGVDAAGFEHPTPIQAAVVPTALEGRDVIGLAQTGSGKTAAFGLPLVERVADSDFAAGLILSPTREIALQTQAFLQLFSDQGIRSECLIGGVKIGPQIDRLRSRKPNILVATPGRLLDHVERRNVNLRRLKVLVLDEADHMLDLGFLPQVQDILRLVPEERQTLMFSATMPPPIERLSQRFMNDPAMVDFRPDGKAAEGIEHRLYLVSEENKRPCILSILEHEKGSTLVFTRRKSDAEWLSRVLEREGHAVDAIHSDRTQRHRLKALRGFREGKVRILVATDVAARGIDVPKIQHVVNYDLPEQVEDYVHRAGRTARGSADGVASSIATWRDKEMVRLLESTLGRKLPRCTAPGVEPYVELNRSRRKVRPKRSLRR